MTVEAPNPEVGITFRVKPEIKDLLLDLRPADQRFTNATQDNSFTIHERVKEKLAAGLDLNAFLLDALRYRLTHPDSGIDVWLEQTEGEEIHPFSRNRIYVDFSKVRGVEGGITLFRGQLPIIAEAMRANAKQVTEVMLRNALPPQIEDPVNALVRTHEEIRAVEEHYSRNNPPQRNQFLSDLRDMLVRRALILHKKGAPLEFYGGLSSRDPSAGRIVIKFGPDEKVILPSSPKYVAIFKELGLDLRQEA